MGVQNWKQCQNMRSVRQKKNNNHETRESKTETEYGEQNIVHVFKEKPSTYGDFDK